MKLWTVTGRRAAVGLLAALFAATASGAQDRGSAADSLARMERQLDRELTTDLELAPTFSAFRELYPVEYRRMVAKLAEANVDGELSKEDMTRAVEELSAIRAKYAPSLSKAPNAELVALIERRAEALKIARLEDADLCDALAHDLLLSSVTAKSRRMREALTEVQIAQLRAEKAGFDRPTQREAPTEDQMTAFVEALVRAGGDQRTIDFLRGDREARNSRERCKAAIIVYDAMTAMPARSAASLMSSMIEAQGEASSETATDASFERALDEYIAAPLLDVLEAEFPEAYSKAREVAMTKLRDGKEMDEVAGDLIAVASTIQLTYASEVQHAGDKELAELTRTRGAALKLARAQDPAFCAEFAERYVYDTPVDATLELQTSLMEYEAALLKAVAAGAKQPVKRADLAKADMQTLVARLARTGVKEEALLSFLSGELDDLPSSSRCDVAIALNDAISLMPEKAAATLTGRVFAQMAAKDEYVADYHQAEKVVSEDVTETDEVAMTMLLRPLSENFPAELEALNKIIEEGAPKSGKDTRADRMAARFSQWAKTNAHYIERAPDAELLWFASTYRDFLQALQRSDVARCAAAGRTIPSLSEEMSQDLDQAYMRSLGAFVTALAAGRDRPVKPRAPTEADEQALFAAVQRLGFDPNDGDALNGRGPVEAQCRVQVFIYQAVTQIAPDAASRLISASSRSLFSGEK